VQLQDKEKTMFTWKARIKSVKGLNEVNLEPIVWFEFPLAFIDDKGKQLLVWYGDLDASQESVGDYDEYWFLIQNASVIDYLANKKTLRTLLLEGKTYLVGVNYFKAEYEFEIVRSINREELVSKFLLPDKNSYLGSLCKNSEEIVRFINEKRKEDERREILETNNTPFVGIISTFIDINSTPLVEINNVPLGELSWIKNIKTKSIISCMNDAVSFNQLFAISSVSNNSYMNFPELTNSISVKDYIEEPEEEFALAV